MRWDNLRQATPAAGGDGLFDLPDAVVRTVDTPGFRGVTFYEVHARSVINRVPAASRLPFRWTINPYRGCTHACRYCFARKTHTYLDLDAGRDFDTGIVVKVNTPELVRKELSVRSWRGEHIAMGTNVDCYQRAEGRYRLMPGVLEALRDHANPFSILTKGTLILRDLPLLRAAAAVTDVAVNVSVGFVDDELWRAVEPGAPSPRRRLDVCRALNDAGVRCGVLMAPILPFLTDSPDHLDRTVRAIARAGAVSVTPIVLHLRQGAREWYLRWLGAARPDLVPAYRRLYRAGSYADRDYQRAVCDQVRALAEQHGITRARESRRTPSGQDEQEQPPEQLTLLCPGHGCAVAPTGTRPHGPPPIWSDRTMHPTTRRVADALLAAGATGEIRELPHPARTAASAAEQLGVEVGAIANSLVFDADGEPVLVLTSGAHRVDTERVAGELGVGTLRRATPEFVRAATGQPIGGVAPVGHPAPLRTLVDTALARYERVWAAGGHPNTVFPTTFAELVRITKGTAAQVGDSAHRGG